MHEDYITVNYISPANINYFMGCIFNKDIIFKSLDDYNNAVELGFDINIWESKNNKTVYVPDIKPDINNLTADDKEELINWWKMYLNIN